MLVGSQLRLAMLVRFGRAQEADRGGYADCLPLSHDFS